MLAILAMLALMGALRVAPGGSAPLFRCAPRHGIRCSGRDEKTAVQPNQKTAATGGGLMAPPGATVKRYVTKRPRQTSWDPAGLSRSFRVQSNHRAA